MVTKYEFSGTNVLITGHMSLSSKLKKSLFLNNLVKLISRADRIQKYGG